MTPDMDRVRQARAGLAVLFEPDEPHLRELIAAAGPVDAVDRLRSGDLPLTGMRRWVRHVPDGQVWAETARRIADCAGGRIVIPEDDDWPSSLADLAAVPCAATDAPAALCLWIRGDRPVAAALARSVTVTGTRASTAYGTHVATGLGFDLARAGWTVVAGGAYGIEAAAHRGGLVGRAGTVAVLPGGLDRLYPTGNRSLLERIADSDGGLLISQYPPGTGPDRRRVRLTGRLLAALTGGTVVVEASHRSGALAVLRNAVAWDHPAMVVPGPVTSALSAGCHDALRTMPRVRLVTGAADVLTELDTPAAPA